MNKIKKYLPEILSLIIPVLIVLLSCLLKNNYPFNDLIFSKYDGLYQYPSFTINFKNALLGKNSLFYSFGGGLGYNFYVTAIYYTFNPTNILCLFANQNNIIDYYFFIILLRISLSSFTMCKYLKYKFKNQKNIFYIMFSICYALMGYNVAYYYNYMYFDNIVFFPILIMGLEKLIYERNNKLYILMLTISILSNFYIGYMECIFSLLYFIYCYYNLNKKDKRIIKDFIISSVLSGIMCTITLLPTIIQLINGKLEHFTIVEQTNYFGFNINFLNIFYKSMPGMMQLEDIKYGSVNIYTSLLVSVLVIKYFFLKNVNKKEKITTLIFILFFLLSISFNMIDYIWHMFQRPIWYPNRYIFTFSFFLILIACKTYINIEKVKQNNKEKILSIVIFISLAIYPIIKLNILNDKIKICSFILGILLLFEYTFLLENKKANIFIVCMLLLEITFNTIITFDNLECPHSYNALQKDINENTEIIKKIKTNESKNNNFYRTHIQRTTIYTQGSFYNYNGIDIFNSIKNSKLIHFFGDQFNYETTNRTKLIFNGYNPYISSIIGIKYINGIPNEDYYEKYNNDIQVLSIYKNNDALALAYMVNNNILNYTPSIDKYENTNELVTKMTNKNLQTYEILNNITYNNTKLITKNNKEYIEVLNKKDNSLIIEGTISKDSFLTFNENRDFYLDTELYINNKKNINLGRNKLPILIKKGDKYKIIFKSNNDSYEKKYTNVYITYLDKYKEFINEIKKNELTITKYEKDDYIKGTINVTNDKTTLFTTIPYDKGWKLYIDNKKVNYGICANAFICTNLDEGEHTIEFKYIPYGFIIGSVISIITLIITIFYIRKK